MFVLDISSLLYVLYFWSEGSSYLAFLLLFLFTKVSSSSRGGRRRENGRRTPERERRKKGGGGKKKRNAIDQLFESLDRGAEAFDKSLANCWNLQEIIYRRYCGYTKWKMANSSSERRIFAIPILSFCSRVNQLEKVFWKEQIRRLESVQRVTSV